LVAAISTLGLGAGRVTAQEVLPLEVLEAVAQFALIEVQPELVPALIVEVEAADTTDPRAVAQAQAWAERLASTLGARTGRVDTLMVCRPGIPPPEMFARGWCRLPADVRHVLRLRSVEFAEQEWRMGVMLYRVPPAETERYVISAWAQKVAVSRGPDGVWGVQPGPLMEMAHWY
jgi:hypothetical protein